MNLFLTKDTAKRFSIKEITKVNDLENKTIFDWAGKIFYLGGRKGIQLMNIESRITLLLFDITVKDMKNISETVFNFLYEIYSDNPSFYKLIDRYREDAGEFEYGYIKDRSALGMLNYTEAIYFHYGFDKLNSFVTNMGLDVISLNMDLNKNGIFTKLENGKKYYINSSEKFKEELKNYYTK